MCIFTHFDTEYSECAIAIFTDYYSINDIFKAFYFSKLNEFSNPSKISHLELYVTNNCVPFLHL